MNKKAFCLHALMVFLVASCGSDKSIVKSEKSTIEHIFISDSINCSNLPSGLIKNEYLVVEHSNQQIENKINAKLLSINDELEERPYSEMVKDINSELEKACLDNTFNEYNTIFRYESVYNQYDILGVLQRIGNYGQIQFYLEAVNLDLISGDVITPDQLFKSDSMQKLIDICNSKVQTTINEEVRSVKENSDSDSTEYRENILELFDKDHGYKFSLDDLNNFVFTINEDKQEGVNFIYTLDFPWAIKNYEPNFELFFTFNELKPFLQDDMIKRLDI